MIFPAKNESATIKSCIDAVKQSKHKPHIIVVDGYSTDKTVEIASANGAEVVTSSKRMHPGKGVAMKTGLQVALKKNPDVILFLDADIKNLTAEWVDKLVDPIIDGRHDMTRGTYMRAARDGGVTKLVARPLLSVFFPEMSHFEQPLSGEVAAKADVWKTLLETAPPDGWGIDVWFLIETVMHGYKTSEIFLGTKEHGSYSVYENDLSKLSKMGEQVGLAVIQEAVKYERIVNANAYAP